ncbi:MAG: DNA-binding protein [Lachnospiraceae bacterium]
MIYDYSSWDSLPLILQAKDIQMILGISKGKTYEIMNSADFPTIHLNKRMMVSKDKFYEWLNKDSRKIKRRAIYVSKKG